MIFKTKCDWPDCDQNIEFDETLNNTKCVCPSCNRETYLMADEKNSSAIIKKDEFKTTFFLCLFLGIFGAHRFYTGKTKSGIFQLLTLGGLLIWSLVDLWKIVLGKFTDERGELIKNTSPKLSWALLIIATLARLASFGQASSNIDEIKSNINKNKLEFNYEVATEVNGIYITDGPVLNIQYSYENASDTDTSGMKLIIRCYDDRGKELTGFGGYDFYPFYKEPVYAHTKKSGSIFLNNRNLKFNPKLIDRVEMYSFQ